MFNICWIQCIPFYSQVETTTVFSNEQDYNNYALDLNNNYYVPQGITKNRAGNLLISWYYWGIDGKYEKDSIITEYNLSTNKIIKTHSLPIINFENPPHVGGLGFTYYRTLSFPSTWNYHDILFVSDGYFEDDVTYVNIYEITSTSITFLSKKKLDSDVKPDAMGYGNGYLWIGRFTSSDNPLYMNKPLNGYKVTIIPYTNIFTLGDEIYDEEQGLISVPNISVKFPKPMIQGIYPISNPFTDSKLGFYFVKSYGDAQSFIYEGILDTKDANGDNKINGAEGTEWKWESFYTPNGDGAYRKLPAGIEGIVEYNNELWVPNEGATAYYSYWNNSDGAREILKANPVNSGNDKLFPAGAILYEGTGIDSNFGIKLVLVMAQNKQGNFYYSIGKLNYTTISYSDVTLSGLLMNTEKPTVLNPIGKQSPVNQRASVYIEDIKAVFIMNLDNISGNSDDWNLSKINIIFDNNKNSAMNTSSLPYKMIMNDGLNFEIGDNIGDSKGILSIFNTKHTLSDQKITDEYHTDIISNTDCYTENLYWLYYYANQCILTNTIDYCLNTYLQTYLSTNQTNIFCRLTEDNSDLLNNSLNRLTPIEIDFCANISDVCD